MHDVTKDTHLESYYSYYLYTLLLAIELVYPSLIDAAARDPKC